MSQRTLSAAEAADRLGISKATLSSYVSRGLIRSEEGEGKTRARRYVADDVEGLVRRKEQRRHPGRAAESALHFGDPVLESAITLIDDGRLYYRGENAIELARTHSFEAVAGLLWGDSTAGGTLFSTLALDDAAAQKMQNIQMQLRQWGHLAPVERFQLALPLAAATDLAAFNQSPDAVAQTGVRILHMLAMVATDAMLTAPIAQHLQQAWTPTMPAAAALLNATLILCADHELNISAFTARCVASTGATPYGAVLAALAALQGPKHGGSTHQVAALLRDAQVDARAAIAEWLRRGEIIPGFGHNLYPQGDPRGRALLGMIAQQLPDAAINTTARAVTELVAANFDRQPNIDFALVILELALGLPTGAALTLFALGRTAGWIGHIIEQYQVGRMIRPRARYVG
ncbi:MAG: citrate/2-methylcitrate synthase [Caldilineaceae bacterium]